MMMSKYNFFSVCLKETMEELEMKATEIHEKRYFEDETLDLYTPSVDEIKEKPKKQRPYPLHTLLIYYPSHKFFALLIESNYEDALLNGLGNEITSLSSTGKIYYSKTPHSRYISLYPKYIVGIYQLVDPLTTYFKRFIVKIPTKTFINFINSENDKDEDERKDYFVWESKFYNLYIIKTRFRFEKLKPDYLYHYIIYDTWISIDTIEA